ncbi:S-protein homolog 1 [Linum grandiflorum]
MASTSQPEKLILAAAVLATTTLLILLSPVPHSVNVHIINNLSGFRDLTVHCRSKDDDLGVQSRGYNSEFSWGFEVNVFGGSTLFWCRLETVVVVGDGRMSASVVVFKQDNRYIGKGDVRWFAEDDGVYLEILLDQYQVKEYVWARWSIS